MSRNALQRNLPPLIGKKLSATGYRRLLGMAREQIRMWRHEQSSLRQQLAETNDEAFEYMINYTKTVIRQWQQFHDAWQKEMNT